jgi:hypothetical protein
MHTRISILIVAIVATVFSLPSEAALDAEAIGKAAAAKTQVADDGVVRISWPRTDVAVTVDGLPLDPFAGLGSWAAFKETPHGAMVMGDTVVFEDEINPAMDAAFKGGLDVTAIHNHFVFDTPKVLFMHIGGVGEAPALAASVKGVWDAIKAVRAASPAPAGMFPGGAVKLGTISPAPLEQILGAKAAANNGVVKFSWGRPGKMHGTDVGGSMNLTTWAAFSGSDSLAAVDGDFIMSAKEVQPVLRALRAAGINVVSLHNHMIGEEPAFFFTHFWGKGAAATLATRLKSVIDAQKAVK